MTDAEVQQTLKSIACAGIDAPGSPAWRMKEDWLRVRAELVEAKERANVLAEHSNADKCNAEFGILLGDFEKQRARAELAESVAMGAAWDMGVVVVAMEAILGSPRRWVVSDVDPPTPGLDPCPKCGGSTEIGYGLAHGPGIGTYRFCYGGCDWSVKTPDLEVVR